MVRFAFCAKQMLIGVGISPVRLASERWLKQESRFLDGAQAFSWERTPTKWFKKKKADPSAALRLSPVGSRFAHAHKTVQLNKTFCYLFTQFACLFEMIVRTYLS